MTARSVLAAGLLAAGLHLLLAGLVPWLSFTRPLSDAQPGTAYAAYAAGGLGLVAAGAALLAVARPDRRWPPLLAAALLPAGIAAAALLPAARSVLAAGEPTPEVTRLLAVAAPAAMLLAPAVLAVVLAPARRPAAHGPPRTLPGWLLPALLAAFAAAVALGMAQAAPFGWDESVYGLLARHWVEGTPASGWDIHRPPALSALGVPPVLLGGHDWQLRAVGLAFGVGLVAATWFAARALGGASAGLLAAAVVAGSTPIAVDAGLFLNDVPAAATLVLGVAVLWRAVERPAPVAWSLLWLAPIAAAAFYLRYGAAVPIVGLGLAAFLAWPARLAAAWPKVLATAALLAVLLLPHIAFSLAQTGSPLGILLTGQAAAGPSAAGPGAPGDGLLEYLDAFPAPLAGLLPAAFMVLGLGAWSGRLVAAVAHRSMDRGTRALTLLVVAAVFQVVVLGMTIHAEPRYVYLAVVLLVIAGSLVLTDAARARDRLGAAVLALAGVAGTVALAVNLAAVPLEMRDRARDGGWERETARRIAAEAPDGDCGVVVYTVPQTSWYSRCQAVDFGDGRGADADARLHADRRFLVVRTDGAAQPDEAVLATYLERAAPGPAIVVNRADGTPAARVYRLEP